MQSQRAIEEVFRQEAGPVLATLIRFLGNFDQAEDALQEAFVAALEQWRDGAMPQRPEAWLLTAARRKAIDRLRRHQTVVGKERELVLLTTLEAEEKRASVGQDTPIPDDLLRLIFCCCNPALGPDAQIALTLKTVCGLSTREIARSLLVPEQTMGQRILRAKKKIHGAKIPFHIPGAEVLPKRLDAVLATVYLIFNEGYFSNSADALIRGDLCDQALQLARTLNALLPEQAEVEGLLALLLLQDSRRDARLDPAGDLVVLPEQDRSLWKGALIAEGQELLCRALRRPELGVYQLQAAIAAVHSEAACADDTDWEQIVGLYQRLRLLQDSPVLRLNQVVALSMLQGPTVGLTLLEPLAQDLDDYQSYHAARADFHRKLGQYSEAQAAYKQALALSDNASVARYCEKRMAECAAGVL